MSFELLKLTGENVDGSGIPDGKTFIKMWRWKSRASIEQRVMWLRLKTVKGEQGRKNLLNVGEEENKASQPPDLVV